MKHWLFKTLFGAECKELDRLRCEAADQKLKRDLAQLAARAAPPVRPARISYTGRLTRQQVEQALAGQRSVAVVQAFQALIEAAIVTAADESGEAPREGYLGRDGVYVPGFTEAMRTHAGGRSDGLAKLLQDLQELIAPQETAAKPAA